MAISEDMRELVVAYGNAKIQQGVCCQREYASKFTVATEESKAAFDKLCYEIEELELKARHWDEHRYY